MADIAVEPRGAGTFHVTVREDDTASGHEVTVSADDVERLGRGRTPEELLRACFEFLLEREPKESILRQFDLPLIGRYFPEYEHTIRG